jgi:hypothetical protein
MKSFEKTEIHISASGLAEREWVRNALTKTISPRLATSHNPSVVTLSVPFLTKTISEN